MQTTITDGGRAENMPNEIRDCTVRALAIAAGISYLESYSILAKAGRKDGHKVNFTKLVTTGKLQGLKFERVGRSRRTVRRFITEHPTGSFICLKRGHAFAIVDGSIHDNEECKEGEIIKAAWTVNKIKAASGF